MSPSASSAAVLSAPGDGPPGRHGPVPAAAGPATSVSGTPRPAPHRRGRSPGSPRPTVQPTDPADDAGLASRIARGDEQALAVVYTAHAPAVHGLALRVTRDGELAAEVTQAVFVRLWREPGRYDPTRGRLRTWLLTEAHSRAVDLVRSESARHRREDAHGGPSGPRPTDPADDAVRSLEAERVRVALARLPDVERDAIVLAYFGGRSYREVAAELGQPEGTVKSRIRTGLRRLRDLLHPGDEPGAGGADTRSAP